MIENGFWMLLGLFQRSLQALQSKISLIGLMPDMLMQRRQRIKKRGISVYESLCLSGVNDYEYCKKI